MMRIIKILATTLLLTSLISMPLLAKVEGNKIILGSAVSLTGKYSLNGQHTKNGYNLAVKRFNERGGVEIKGKKYQLEIIYYDDESTPARAAQLAERLIKQDDIKYILGPYSTGITLAMAPVTEKYGIPMIEANGSSNSLFDKGYKYLFAILTAAEDYLSPAVSALEEVLKKEKISNRNAKIAIAVENDAFSLSIRNGVLKAAKKARMKIVLDEKLPKSLEDMSAILTKVKVLRPHLLVVSGHAKGVITAARQIEEFKVKVPMIAATHCDGGAIELKYPKGAEGMLCALQWQKEITYNDDDKLFGTGLDFAVAFEKEYGYAPPYQAAESAAAVQVWVDSLKRARSFGTKDVRNAIAKTKFQSFYGNIKFDKFGKNIAKPMLLSQIVKGEYKVVYPSQYANDTVKYPRN